MPVPGCAIVRQHFATYIIAFAAAVNERRPGPPTAEKRGKSEVSAFRLVFGPRHGSCNGICGHTANFDSCGLKLSVELGHRGDYKLCE